GLAPLIPGLRHNFYLDDFRWLEHAYYASRDIGHLFTQWLPGFIRPIGQAVFFLEFLAFRFQALPYNIASLLLHAIVGSMVWRLCRRIGIGATGRSIAAAMFLIGAGHFTKAVHWACSIPILCGTALLLWTVTTIAPHSHSASRSSSPANGASSAVRGFRLAILTLAGVALPFTHDLFALAPLGLAAVVVAVGHRQRRLLGSIWMTAGLAYVVGTLSAHADVTQPHKIGWNALANAFHSFACL